MRAWLSIVLFAFVLSIASAGATQPDNTARDRAVALFKEAQVALAADDLEGALDLYLRSRDLFAGRGNTQGAAHCLHRLGRYDEALVLYEWLLAHFEDELSPKNVSAAKNAIVALLKRVGSIEIVGNVDGLVVIDGRDRGRLPLRVPVRVLPGERTVTIIKDGYQPFEKRVTVVLDKPVRIDAKLDPLAQAGILRIEDPDNEGSTVYVDGAPMGASPWEGTLGPGEHVVWSRGDDRGSAPTRAVVVQGQKAVVSLSSRVLGSEITVSTVPTEATITIGDVRIASGRWRGRLPTGEHTFTFAEPGYVDQSARITSEVGARRERTIELVVDPDHPRWPRPLAGDWELGVFGGYAIGPSLRSDAEQTCTAGCPSSPIVHGFVAGARLGYRFSFGFAPELVGGYLRVTSSFDRESALGGGPNERYRLSDSIALSGPLVTLGVSQRGTIAGPMAITGRIAAGGFFGRATDDVTASGTLRDGTAAPVIVTGTSGSGTTVNLLLHSEVALSAAFGPWSLGIALGIAAVTGSGATLENRATAVALACDAEDDPGCLPTRRALPDEEAFHTFLMGTGVATISYTF